MSTDQILFEHYDGVVDSPEAVSKLRIFILDLAVRGRLVKQDSDDEPAKELLNRIAKERGNVGILGQDTSANLDAIDHIYELPRGWEWCVIESVAQVVMGQSPPSEHCNKSGHGMSFFQGKANFGSRHPIPRNWCVKPKKIAESGDILISVRAPVGPTNVADQRCCIGRGLAALRPFSGVDREYLLLTLKALEIDLSSKGYGTTFSAITKKQLTNYSLPLPPIAEQHRIVAKVDELFTICTELESSHHLRARLNTKLLDATIHGVY